MKPDLPAHGGVPASELAPALARQHLISLPARNTGLSPVQPNGESRPSVNQAERALGRVRVLLVEDHPGDAQLIRIHLQAQEQPHFVVNWVSTLAEARSLAESNTFDVILLDLSLPDSNGVRTVALMRNAAPTLPIVIMTGLLDPQLADKALEMGAQDYLIKGEDSGSAVSRAIRYAMARMAAQLERQFLIQRLEHEQATTRHELDEARSMQFSILPRGPAIETRLAEMGVEILSYFEPSFAVGGDLWGCLDYGPDRIAIYAFDFSGHGVSAALNVFRLHTLITEYAHPTDGPGTSLKKINRALVSSLKRGQYATMFLGIIDSSDNSLTWAASGYPRPLLFTPDGKKESLNSSGIPIGLIQSASYDNRRIEFPPGSSLFLHSDAMEEANVEKGKILGDEALLELITEHRRTDNSIDLDALLTHFFASVNTPVEDDLTALAIRRLPDKAGLGAPEGRLVLLCDDPAMIHHPPTTDLPVIHTEDWNPEMGMALTYVPVRDDLLAEKLRLPSCGLIEAVGPHAAAAIHPCRNAILSGGFALSLTTRTMSRVDIATLIADAVKIRFTGTANLPPGTIELCVAEAVGNAIIHGNLGIRGDERNSSQGFMSFLDEINLKMENQQLSERHVLITVTPTQTGHVMIAVTDQGTGFDLGAHLISESALDSKHGRGISLISKLAQSIHGQNDGRTIVMTL